MELYEAVSRRMGIPEVVIRGFMGYMRQSRIFVVTFLGMLDPIQRTISTPQVDQLGVSHVKTGGWGVVLPSSVGRKTARRAQGVLFGPSHLSCPVLAVSLCQRAC